MACGYRYNSTRLHSSRMRSSGIMSVFSVRGAAVLCALQTLVETTTERHNGIALARCGSREPYAFLIFVDQKRSGPKASPPLATHAAYVLPWFCGLLGKVGGSSDSGFGSPHAWPFDNMHASHA